MSGQGRNVKNLDPDDCGLSESGGEALMAVSAVFGSLGRAFICLDADFRILHVSPRMMEMVEKERAGTLVGGHVSALLGTELFGDDGTLRRALVNGERREGWRASIESGSHGLLVSVTAAPFIPDDAGVCDRRVKYIVVVRPAEEDEMTGTTAPTVFSGLIARSAVMQQIFHLIENLRGSDATILLTGESGTGKEVVARAIHKHSSRRKGQFIAVNCAGLPGDLLESELFGHVRGAFTGAVRDRTGRFEMASGGTLFLDEIGDLPLHLQVKLLRVLQERTFERVGESRSRTTDARIIAATHVDLRRAALEGRFRDDLYYRLRVVPIEIPPIRARREDIEPLARYLLARVCARQGREVRFSPATLRAMLRYAWPGNVRELENAIEYAVAVGKGQTIQPEDLPVEVFDPENENVRRGLSGMGDGPLRAPSLGGREPHGTRPNGDDEVAILRAALEANQWRRDDAARALGISRTTLWRRMREAGLSRT